MEVGQTEIKDALVEVKNGIEKGQKEPRGVVQGEMRMIEESHVRLASHRLPTPGLVFGSRIKGCLEDEIIAADPYLIITLLSIPRFKNHRKEHMEIH
ncbi:hypothetical protein NPIL_98221 [Nephila pilipes]|uniref:Uncharacterized protein n=1 Tax=Nephila pilipes TaxID=299642 RepID=A0A8X6PR27_NEPPI|nr:hypothetical protein NPIL_98221 [Nephila pilipes]